MSDCFFRTDKRQNVSAGNDDFCSNVGLIIVGVETGCGFGVVMIGAVFERFAGVRLALNFIRRSSLSRAISVSSEGGCCNCFCLLEQNVT